MPSLDEVRVMRIMTRETEDQKRKTVAIAIHWGTFTSDLVEVLKTLGQLE